MPLDLTDHLRHCVSNAVSSSDAEDHEVLAEVTGTIQQVVRLWLWVRFALCCHDVRREQRLDGPGV